MKKRLTVTVALALLLFSLSGCSKDSFMDISAFTHYYNKAAGRDEIVLGDYFIRENSYSLLFSDEGNKLLMTAEAVETGKIDEIRLLISKVDDAGNKKQITESEAELFCNKLGYILQAYTTLSYDECESVISEMKLIKTSTFESEGELTLTKEDWHMVYFSTEIASVFMIYNIHLHPIEKTEKPQSKPAFGNTANTRTETVPLK